MTDLRIGDDSFNVLVEGDVTKPPLMLSHSLGTDLTMWDVQVPALLEHFRVVRYDTRGHGGSAATGAVTIEQLGRDALAILDALEIERVHWIGLSMGGVIGQWLLLNAPERIERAVLANTAAKLGTPDGWNQRILAAIAGDRNAAADATMERWFSAGFRQSAPEQVGAIDRLLRTTDPSGYAACCAAIRDMDLRQSLAGNPALADATVLIVTGKDDPTVSDADTTFLTDVFAGAKHVALDAKHISSVEDAAAFTTAVVDFLTSKPVRRKTPTPVRVAKPTASVRRPPKRRSTAARVPLKSAAKSTVPAATTTKPSAARGKASARPAARVAAPAKTVTKAKTPKMAASKPATSKAKPKAEASKTAPKRAASKVRGATAPATRTKTSAPRTAAPKPGRVTARTAVGKTGATKAGKTTAKTASKAAAPKAKATPAPRKPAAASARGGVKAPVPRKTATKAAPAKVAKAKPVSARTATGKTGAKTTARKALVVKAAPKKAAAKKAPAAAKAKAPAAKPKTVSKAKVAPKTKPVAKAPARRKPAPAKPGRRTS